MPDYIDSAIDKIRAFDYDIASGQLTNEREFQPSPEPLEPGAKIQGCFDGLTMDGVGNVWVARWSDGRVMGFRPDGSLIANIKTPGCLSPTIPCFGGEHRRQRPLLECGRRRRTRKLKTRGQPRDNVHRFGTYQVAPQGGHPAAVPSFRKCVLGGLWTWLGDQKGAGGRLEGGGEVPVRRVRAAIHSEKWTELDCRPHVLSMNGPIPETDC